MSDNKIIIGINASFARKPNNGIGQVTINFLKKLIELKVQNEKLKVILYLEEDLPKGFKLPKNFEKRIFLPVWKRDDLIRKIWWEKCSLPKKVKKDKCDVFLSLYQCPTIIKSAKHVMLIHDIIPKLFPEYLNNSRKKYYQKLIEKAAKKADRIITVSKNSEKDIINNFGISGDKITVNYIDVDPDIKKKPSREKISKVLKKYKLKPGYILAGGGMEIRKNVEGVIRAYKYLLDKLFSHDSDSLPPLVIYGKLMPGNTLALDAEKLIKELNLTKKVKLLDIVPQEAMPALYSEANMFVYPSHYEGFGMPPLEAMSQGIPTIVSKKSSLPEVGSDAVLYCNPDDMHDLAMVMKNVLGNSDLRLALSEKGKAQATKFSWTAFTEKILNIVAQK